MFCTSCGSKIPETARFCPVCGHRVYRAQAVGDSASAESSQSSTTPTASSPVNDAATPKVGTAVPDAEALEGAAPSRTDAHNNGIAASASDETSTGKPSSPVAAPTASPSQIPAAAEPRSESVATSANESSPSGPEPTAEPKTSAEVPADTPATGPSESAPVDGSTTSATTSTSTDAATATKATAQTNQSAASPASAQPSSLGEQVSEMRAAKRKIPLFMLVVLVALGVAATAFAATMTWKYVIAPAIERAQQSQQEQAQQNQGAATDAASDTATAATDEAAAQAATAGPAANGNLNAFGPAIPEAYPVASISFGSDSNSPQWTAVYDAQGRLSSVSIGDREGDAKDVITYTYDGKGRLNTITQDRAYASEAAKQRSTSIKPKTRTFTYDDEGRVIKVDMGNRGTRSYSYDDQGRLSTLTDSRSGGTTTYTYDDKGNLSSATTTGASSDAYIESLASPNGTATFEHDDRGNLTKAVYTDGSTASYTYDDTGRTTKVTITATSQSTMHPGGAVDYSYDGQGRLSRVTSQGGYMGTEVYSYNYDGSGRLINVTNADGATAVELNYRGAPDRKAESEDANIELTYSTSFDTLYGPFDGMDVNAPANPLVVDPTPRDPARSAWYYDYLTSFRV